MAGRPYTVDGEPRLSFERLERYRQQGARLTFEVVLLDEQWFVFVTTTGGSVNLVRKCVVGERSGEPNTMDVNRLFNQICKVKELFPDSLVTVDIGKFRLVETAPDEKASELLAMLGNATPVQIGIASRLLGLSGGPARVPQSIINAMIYLEDLIGKDRIAAAVAAIRGAGSGSGSK